MLNLKRFAIFSLKGLEQNSGIDETSSYRLTHIRAILKDKGIWTKVVLGSYKGATETSIVAIVDTDLKLDIIRDIAFRDGQESILIVNEDRKAYLEYNNKTVPEYIGAFRNVSALEASELDNWTLDGTDYYTTI